MFLQVSLHIQTARQTQVFLQIFATTHTQKNDLGLFIQVHKTKEKQIF
jgi:hypothetical protein